MKKTIIYIIGFGLLILLFCAQPLIVRWAKNNSSNPELQLGLATHDHKEEGCSCCD